METTHALVDRIASEPRRDADPALGPVGTVVEGLLAEAVRLRASDLHLDPRRGGTAVRLRVDGFFVDGPGVPSAAHDRIVARVKVLAGLTVYRRDEIQEGSIRRDDGVELRVSILPTVAGEKVTIRIFDPRQRPFQLRDLGFAPDTSRTLERLAGLGQGTVVVCGPSGSGKTTTLYAMLERIREQRGAFANLCSVEDPVEFALDAVHQMPVVRERGLTFARGLAALLRQDPEVILVGEVRDRETAEIAVEAGMTGHLVLTSLHAGRASEALTRLAELGVEPYAAATSVRAVIAQRLLRRVCSSCAVDAPPDAATLAGWTRSDESAGDRSETGGSWRHGVGCGECRGTGYHGRVPVAEILDVDRDTVSRILARHEATSLSQGLTHGRTLLDAALHAARCGVTTLDEVVRVIGTDGVGS